MRKAFTLIELMIVVLLISLVYGLYFYTIKKEKVEDKFSLFKIKTYLNTKAKKYGDKLTLICSEDSKDCYLLDSKQKIVEEFEIDERVKVFVLKDDEKLEPNRYRSIELTKKLYLEPMLIFKKLTKELFETLIYYKDDGKWVYVSPYFDDTKEFLNKEEIISYIKKREYLPMYSGLAE